MQPFYSLIRPLRQPWLPLWGLALMAIIALPAAACTSIIVTRGASADGSVMVTYSCDLAGLYGSLSLVPAADHKPGESIAVKPRGPQDKRPRGKIPQVPHTYKVLGLMNEHQLAIAETTFGGREGLHNPLGMIDCLPMMNIALQRARTAREAIRVMTRLVAEYGYGDEGESFSIADTQEAWILEMVGTGPGGKGAVWVAVRIPDGQVSCHANAARIGEFPRDDPANCLYSENVESFARSKGWYDPKSGEAVPFLRCVLPRHAPFAADLRYAGLEHSAARGALAAPHARLPSFQARLAALSLVAAAGRQALGGRCFRAHARSLRGHGVRHDAGPRRRALRPAATLAAAGLEGRRRGATSGSAPSPRSRPAFTFVSQSRAWLPDPVGGLYWYGVDDAYTSCYIPLVLRHRRLAQELRGRLEPQVLLGLGVVGLQLRVELRLSEVVVHGSRNSRLPEGHRVELPGPSAGGGENGGRASQDQPQPGRALSDGLLA